MSSSSVGWTETPRHSVSGPTLGTSLGMVPVSGGGIRGEQTEVSPPLLVHTVRLDSFRSPLLCGCPTARSVAKTFTKIKGYQILRPTLPGNPPAQDQVPPPSSPLVVGNVGGVK